MQELALLLFSFDYFLITYFIYFNLDNFMFVFFRFVATVGIKPGTLERLKHKDKIQRVALTSGLENKIS
jgi:hypothetical protein